MSSVLNHLVNGGFLRIENTKRMQESLLEDREQLQKTSTYMCVKLQYATGPCIFCINGVSDL